MGENKKTLKNAILSQCHSCQAHYLDGRMDCECHRCSLYPWMPYRKKEPNMDWIKYNPKRTGLVTWEDSKPKITDERRQELSIRMKNMARKKG